MPSHTERTAESPKKNMTTQEIREATALFKRVDLDGSGCIDLMELTKMFDAMDCKMNETEIMLLFQEIDRDRDGVISFTEFLRAFALQKIKAEKHSDELNMANAFQECGGNGDKTGCADRNKVAALLKEFDFDIDIESVFHDDRISYDQFNAVFR